MKRKILFLWILLCSSVAYSQVGFDLPKLTTPSPKSTMIDRFGEYSTNLFNGLVDISIPIYTIEVNGMQVPIEFKYHASGLKYDDMPMELGLGWTLMAGGTVTYSARCAPDGGFSSQHYKGFFVKESDSINTEAKGIEDSDHYMMNYIMNGHKVNNQQLLTYADSEFDVYSYSFPGHSGKFYCPYETDPFFVPAKPLKIVSLSPMEIVDEKGITYSFKMLEYDTERRNVTHYLEHIISANKSDTITFQYKTFSWTSEYAVSRPYSNRTLSIIDFYHPNTIEPEQSGTHTADGGDILGIKDFYPPVLTSIHHRGGKVDFEYIYNRSLQKITVYNSRNQIIRTVSLQKREHTWLDCVSFKDSGNKEVYNYNFEYNGEIDRNSGIDYWGYYNGSSRNGSAGYIPNYTVQTSRGAYKISGMDRRSNYSYMEKGILKRITYPTKGYTHFDYEAHNAYGITYGGLRIEKITSFDKKGNLSEQKIYKYGEKESGEGEPVAMIYEDDFYTSSCNITYTNQSPHAPLVWKVEYIRTYHVNSQRSYFMQGSSVVYPYVTEYRTDGKKTLGKTVYTYRYEKDNYDSSSAKGKTRTEYPYRSYHWKNGLLVSKTISDAAGNKIYSIYNHYGFMKNAEYLNFRVLPYFNLIADNADYLKLNYNRENENSQLGSYISPSYFEFYNYYISTGLPIIEYSTEFKDGVSTYTGYLYNDLGLPIQTKQVRSNGIEYFTQYKYPYELKTSGIYSTMHERNMHNYVIEELSYKKGEQNNEFLSKMKTNYATGWANAPNLIAPSFVEHSTKNETSLEERLQYHKYDSYGNPVYITKDNSESIVYVWGYNGQYPIAEIANTTYNEVETAIKSVFGVTDINALTKQKTPNETKLKDGSLQKALPNALVTTYTYQPLVGVLTATNPQEVTVHYTYDNFGRLEETYYYEKGSTTKKQVLENYNYKYRPQ